MQYDTTSRAGFTSTHRTVGRIAAAGVFVLGVAYAAVTALGFRSLASPADPIGPPYVTAMELLVLPLAALYLVAVAAIHAYARPEAKLYSLVALAFVTVLAGLTTSVHFLVLAVGPALEAAGVSWAPYVFSFTWPSVLYALDILAWDWFFALSLLFASLVFRGGGLERAIRVLLVVSGVLSLAGLAGVPLGDMSVRNVGIVGYAVVSPVAFLLIAVLFGRVRPAPDAVNRDRDARPVA